MKKLVGLLMLILCSVSVKAQYANVFEENNTSVDFYINGVYTHRNNEERGGIGIGFTAYGVYADISFTPTYNRYDFYRDSYRNQPSSLACHIGYQVPLTSTIRIIPVVGYSKVSRTDADRYDWYYDREHKVSEGIDTGGIISIAGRSSVAPILNIGVTNTQVWIGVGVKINN